MEPTALFLFGTPRLTHNQIPIHIGRKRAMGLLAYLAVNDHPLTRDHLVAFFWPEHAPDQAYAELRRTLSVLRQALGNILDADRETVSVAPDSSLQVDVRMFQDLITAWREHRHRQTYSCEECFTALNTASKIYRDHFLAGFSLADSGEFDNWQTLQEQTLRSSLGSALEWLSQYYSAHGDMEPAIGCAKRWLSLDSLNESAHILLMQLFAKSGKRASVVRQFEECERVLLAELGLQPQAETIRMFKSLLGQQEQQLIERDLPGFETGKLPKNNLPFQTIPFMGREELEEVIESNLKNPGCRLLTLTGPGGSGKSRLAIEVARKHLRGFPDGVYFVRLAACESVTEIAPRIAKVLGLTFSTYKESAIQSKSVQNLPVKQQLLGFLHDKTMLIVLDNFEHLLGGVDLLIDILEAAPHVLLLVTSRIRLNILYEYVCPVPGLDLPVEYPLLAPIGPTDELAKYSAVRFFEKCAQMTSPQFRLDIENQVHVLHICRAVHGMPLGILLATSWLTVLKPKEICAEIDQNFDFLETTLYGLPERQRSMRAVFSHTWRLLSGWEQQILQGLSVFRGGFSRQAASFVSGASLSDLKTLASKWLIERDHQDRFILHELLRQYLAERLDEYPGEKVKRKDRHLMFFANFLQGRSGDLQGNEPRQAIAEISLEIENIRAAWSWALSQQNLEAIDRSLEGLAKFYELGASYQEGEKAFTQAREVLILIKDTGDWNDKNRLLLGKIFIRQGLFCGMQGLVKETREALRKGLDFLQDSGDRKEQAFAMLYLAECLTSNEEQLSILNRALVIFTELDERKGIAYIYANLGYIAFSQGDFPTARQYFIHNLDIQRQLGNQRDIAFALSSLGYIDWIMGDYPAALRYFQGRLAIMEEFGDKQGLADSYNLLALAFGGLRDYARAKEYIWKTFYTSKETGNLGSIAVSLTNIAECELMEGNDAEAYRLAKESYPYYKKMDEQLTNADWYFRTLGESECGLGNPNEGKFHLHQALQIQVAGNTLAQATHTLISIARYYEQIGQKERAFELLGLVLSHSGSWQWVRDRAASLVEKFKQGYLLEAVNTALERGRSLDLEQTVMTLLDELLQEDSI